MQAACDCQVGFLSTWAEKKKKKKKVSKEPGQTLLRCLTWLLDREIRKLGRQELRVYHQQDSHDFCVTLHESISRYSFVLGFSNCPSPSLYPPRSSIPDPTPEF